MFVIQAGRSFRDVIGHDDTMEPELRTGREGGRTDADHTAAWYRRAADELRSTSELQTAWASGVAADPVVAERIARLRREHRQPSLIFSVANLLGAPAATYSEWRVWLLANWDAVAGEAAVRRTQTNEPQRCAPLVAALARIPGPLALLELGAAAGLCLLADRYSYRFDDGPALGEGSPVVTCETSGKGTAPDALPDIVWRRGIDLAPLSATDLDDRAWLEALLPPDRPERLARLRAALATAAVTAIAHPPLVVAGDALAELTAQIAVARAEAPADATLVVVSLGTLVYLPPADRAAVLATATALGARVVTLEPQSALPEVAARIETDRLTAPDPTPFLLALDGIPVAYASAHGDRLSWLSADPGLSAGSALSAGQPDAAAAAS